MYLISFTPPTHLSSFQSHLLSLPSTYNSSLSTYLIFIMSVSFLLSASSLYLISLTPPPQLSSCLSLTFYLFLLRMLHLFHSTCLFIIMSLISYLCLISVLSLSHSTDFFQLIDLFLYFYMVAVLPFEYTKSHSND